jgi:hypothetical protein
MASLFQGEMPNTGKTEDGRVLDELILYFVCVKTK